MVKMVSIIAVAFWILYSVSGVTAAEIIQVKDRVCHLELRGEIIEGDLKRLRVALDNIQKELNDNNKLIGDLRPGEIPRFVAETEIPSICLNSDGGSFAAALEIIQFMLTTGGVATVVDSGQRCLSACALIFMFGHIEAYHTDKFFDRRLHVKGSLGFHAPLVRAETPLNEQLAAKTYRAGVMAVGRLLEIDRNEFLARDLVIQFLKMGPNEFLEVDTIDKAGAWTIELVDYKSPAVITKAMVTRACDNEEAWSERRKTREYVIGRFVNKDLTGGSAKLLQTKKTELLSLPGYGLEGGGQCIVNLQDHGGGRIAMTLEIVTDEDKIEQGTNPDDAGAPLGRLLVEPGFGRVKPLWFLYSPKRRLSELANEGAK